MWWKISSKKHSRKGTAYRAVLILQSLQATSLRHNYIPWSLTHAHNMLSLALFLLFGASGIVLGRAYVNDNDNESSVDASNDDDETVASYKHGKSGHA